MLKVFDKVDTTLIPMLEKKSQELGLSILDSSKKYDLKKLGAKVESKMGYPNSFEVIKGHPYLVGVVENDKTLIWLCFFSYRGFDYFKTSPIIGFSNQEDVMFEIETENSIYQLKEIE